MEMLTVKGGGEKWGIGVGDWLLEVNGHPVEDIIDWIFYSDSERIALKIQDTTSKTRDIMIDTLSEEKMNLQFEPMAYRYCPNHCLFCFVDQLPAGLRKNLYFKDEDYRLSFLFGNYITLTNLSEEDLRRIIAQTLSPLYISVHSTDDPLRRRMLGNPKAPSLLPLMKRLIGGGIKLHTQIVLCPGINDGSHLRQTVWDLASLYPGVSSVAIVPVGLTKWREGLYPLRPVGKRDCVELIKEVEGWRGYFRKEMGSGFIWLADEVYLKAGRRIPPVSHYEGFPQVEDGVGMWRLFRERWKGIQSRLRKDARRDLRITMVTGRLAQKLMEGVRDDLSRLSKVKVRLLPLSNWLFGEEVTVSGLLSGQRILEEVMRSGPCGDVLFLPSNCLNQDGRFLDDLCLKEMESDLNCQIFLDLEEGLRTLSLLKESSCKSSEDYPILLDREKCKTEFSFPR